MISDLLARGFWWVDLGVMALTWSILFSVLLLFGLRRERPERRR